MFGNLVIATLLVIGGALTGWGMPLAVRSERPFGVAGDMLASTSCMLVVGMVEWILILPALGIKGLLGIAVAIADPWALALIVLWLIRRIKS